MLAIEHVQTYLRQSAFQRYEAVPVPPFTLFFHPVRIDPHTNYAIPDAAVSGDLQAVLGSVRQVFASRRRYARFEFIEQCAPGLAPVLRANGFVEEERTALMVCSLRAAAPVPAPVVPGLVITPLGADADLGSVRALMEVQQRAFDMDDDPQVSESDARQFLRWLAGTTLFLATLDGVPVAGGSLMPPIAGLAEVAGIATLPEFRGRGIATAVTAQAVQSAFERGLEYVFLTAADERAGRVYERVGFRQTATALAYIDDRA